MNFPIKPDSPNQEITKPSSSFIKETYKVGFSIVGFVFVYFVLILLTSALAFIAGFIGYVLFTSYASLITFMIGIALLLFALLIIIFLFKFLVSKNNHNLDHLHEITASEEPEIFSFIKKVADEVGTQYPKKVYLSNEVNAYVFYDSNFWSLFFPVQKNLVLGLGLVNAINTSEFKAIIAHEFGHFSQKSMKLGSYIYYVNRVIH